VNNFVKELDLKVYSSVFGMYTTRLNTENLFTFLGKCKPYLRI